MKKKGFTLIELLAVILILGIIALIAIPTVNNIISEARMGAFKSGNEVIIKSIEESCQMDLIKGKNPVLSYVFTDGKSSNKIDVKGSLPKDGYIFLDNNCNVNNYYLADNNNVYSNSDDVRKDYMIKAPNNDNNSILSELYNSYYNKIKNVYVINHLNISESAIEIKDILVSQNGKIKSWLIEDGEYYDLYIGSEKLIYTNYNSSSLFANLENVQNIYLDNLSTSFSTNLQYFFYNNMLLENVDVSKLDISNATNIQWFFYKCNLLEKIEVEYWNTSNVTNMECLFDDCLSVKELKVSNWDTSSVVNMKAAFSDLVSITTLDISKWNTSKVTNMDYLFDGYDYGSNIKTIDISNWDVSNVTNMKNIFSNVNLEKIKINNWSLNSEVETGDMFLYADKLNYIECSNVNTINLFSEGLLTKTTDAPGIIKVNGDKTGIDLTVLTAKNWNVI